MDRLWAQVKPLYDALHCYTRAQLNEKYGDAVQPKTGPIRADLLGNMWAQEWGNIYDVVAPKGAGDIGYDIGELLVAKQYDPVRMVKAGEEFLFVKLGFHRAAARHVLGKIADRQAPRPQEVICHASAWDLDNKDDVRIKTCALKVNSGRFRHDPP